MAILGIIGKILLIILLCVMLILLMLLFVPVHYRIEGAFGDVADYEIRVSWLLRLFRFRIARKTGKDTAVLKAACFTISGKPRRLPLPQKKRHVKQEAPPKQKTLSEKLRKWQAVLTYPDLKSIIVLAIVFIKKILYVLKPRVLRVEGCVGFGDPYATGLFFGGYEAIVGVLRLRDAVRLTSDFERSVCELRVSVSGKVRLVMILWSVCWLLLQKPILKWIFGKDESHEQRER